MLTLFQIFAFVFMWVAMGMFFGSLWLKTLKFSKKLLPLMILLGPVPMICFLALLPLVLLFYFIRMCIDLVQAVRNDGIKSLFEEDNK